MNTKVTTTIPSEALAGVTTTWFGPTNTKGSRIRVQRSDHSKGDTTKWFPYDHSLNLYDNHRFAAVAYIDMMEWQGDYVAAATDKGYTFARVPRTFALENKGAFAS